MNSVVFLPGSCASDPFCEVNPKWDPLAWGQMQLLWAWRSRCDGSLLGVRCLEIGGLDAKEMALLQGHRHPSMLLSHEFKLWEIRELAFPLVGTDNHTSLLLWCSELWIYAIGCLPFLLITWPWASHLISFPEYKTVLAYKCYHEI